MHTKRFITFLKVGVIPCGCNYTSIIFVHVRTLIDIEYTYIIRYIEIEIKSKKDWKYSWQNPEFVSSNKVPSGQENLNKDISIL